MVRKCKEIIKLVWARSVRGKILTCVKILSLVISNLFKICLLLSGGAERRENAYDSYTTASTVRRANELPNSSD